MFILPCPVELRRDVVAEAHKDEAPANPDPERLRDLEASLRNWLKRADIEDGVKLGTTEKHAAELRDARRKTQRNGSVITSNGARLGQRQLGCRSRLTRIPPPFEQPFS